jgi:CBS domain containing-hemolysin-like protein
MEMLGELFLLIVFIALNGFFVASEYALITLRKTHVDDLARSGDTSAKLLSYAIEHLDQYVSATQLGVTIASLAVGWIGETSLAKLLAPLFVGMPPALAFITGNGVAALVAFAIVTFLTIVFGELAPKMTALQRTETVGFFIIRPLTLFTKIFLPAIWLLNHTGNTIVRFVGINPKNVQRQIYSEREIAMIASSSAASGAIQKEEAELVSKALRLDDIAVSELMRHKKDIRAIASDTLLRDVVLIINRDTHNRFPVYKDSFEHIIGYVHVKDIYKLLLNKKEMTPLSEHTIIRPLIFVPNMRKASEVLLEMRKRAIQMAIIQDKENEIIGLVTTEDIFESLVGEVKNKK